MKILDANVFLRYFIGDNVEMAEESRRLLDEGEIFMPFELLAEVLYVLTKVYGIKRNETAVTLMSLLEAYDIRTTNDETTICALMCYQKNNLDFVDCILYAYHMMDGYEIRTFDKRLNRLLQRESPDPPL